jgi:hypothetical protein
MYVIETILDCIVAGKSTFIQFHLTIAVLDAGDTITRLPSR